MHIRTISTGGLLLDESVAFVGRDAEDVIRRVNADVMLFSCRGVTEDGMVCDSSLEETSIRREMVRQGEAEISALRQPEVRSELHVQHMPG